jgi:hypothetical protein
MMYDWSSLRKAQQDLYVRGYAFNVSTSHHTVYFKDTKVASVVLEGAGQEKDLYSHWSSAIQIAVQHDQARQHRLQHQRMERTTTWI